MAKFSVQRSELSRSYFSGFAGVEVLANPAAAAASEVVGFRPAAVLLSLVLVGELFRYVVVGDIRTMCGAHCTVFFPIYK